MSIRPVVLVTYVSGLLDQGALIFQILRVKQNLKNKNNCFVFVLKHITLATSSLYIYIYIYIIYIYLYSPIIWYICIKSECKKKNNN